MWLVHNQTYRAPHSKKAIDTLKNAFMLDNTCRLRDINTRGRIVRIILHSTDSVSMCEEKSGSFVDCGDEVISQKS